MEKDSKIQIRDLLASDYKNGFINVLSHLTETGNITEDMFVSQYDLLKYKKDYKIVVAIDTTTQKIVGTGTLFIEHKFIRSLATKGHIEDIVVLPDYRGQHIGQRIIQTLLD
ncbi:glucosamine 6-phosphate N-acetyltransferase, partial [Hamiltosporidium magnivora]